jgi:hypothetical protein
MFTDEEYNEFKTMYNIIYNYYLMIIFIIILLIYKWNVSI